MGRLPERSDGSFASWHPRDEDDVEGTHSMRRCFGAILENFHGRLAKSGAALSEAFRQPRDAEEGRI